MHEKRALCALCGLLALSLGACCDTPKIEGVWTEPVPGMEDRRQGIRLEAGGEAVSVGMETLRYERWERQGDRLILQGKSLGNGQTIDFSDTLGILALTGERLELQRSDGSRIGYERQ